MDSKRSSATTAFSVGVILIIKSLTFCAFAQDFEIFSYDPNAANGPLNWGNINITGNTCNGQAQSGIDIVTHGTCHMIDGFEIKAGDCTLGDLTFVIDPHAAAVFINTSNCEEPTLLLESDSRSYRMFSYHIHAGSEHHINGQSAEAEIHFAHSTEDVDHYGVIALLVNGDSQRDNPLMTTVLAKLADSNPLCAATSDTVVTPRSSQLPLPDNMPVRPSQLIPDGTSFYLYEGSFTTPPCPEIATYMVAEDILSISRDQMDLLLALILDWKNPSNACAPGSIAFNGTTARPIQDLNGRGVTRICPGTSNDEDTDENSDEDIDGKGTDEENGPEPDTDITIIPGKGHDSDHDVDAVNDTVNHDSSGYSVQFFPVIITCFPVLIVCLQIL